MDYSQLTDDDKKEIRDEVADSPPNADVIASLEREHYQITQQLATGTYAGQPGQGEARLKEIEEVHLPRLRGGDA